MPYRVTAVCYISPYLPFLYARPSHSSLNQLFPSLISIQNSQHQLFYANPIPSTCPQPLSRRLKEEMLTPVYTLALGSEYQLVPDTRTHRKKGQDKCGDVLKEIILSLQSLQR